MNTLKEKYSLYIQELVPIDSFEDLQKAKSIVTLIYEDAKKAGIEFGKYTKHLMFCSNIQALDMAKGEFDTLWDQYIGEIPIKETQSQENETLVDKAE